MICPYCGNNEWAYLYKISERVAFCDKCCNLGPIEEFQTIDRAPKGIYDRRDNQIGPNDNISSSSMVGIHSHIQTDTETTRIYSVPTWLL